MNESWKEWMGFVPLLVAITTTLLAFLFGKATEKQKRFYSKVDGDFNAILSKMYREAIDITEIQNYDSRKIKKFILKYANDENMYKLHDDELIYKFLALSIQVRKGTIDEADLALAFKWLSIDIQHLFWDTLKVSTNDFKWWKNRKTISPLVGIPLNIFFIFKDVFEYLCGLFIFFLFFVVIDVMDGNVSHFIKDYVPAIKSLSASLFIIYVLVFIINNLFGDKRDFKKKKIIKQSK